jgi:hypothetical protein
VLKLGENFSLFWASRILAGVDWDSDEDNDEDEGADVPPAVEVDSDEHEFRSGDM